MISQAIPAIHLTGSKGNVGFVFTNEELKVIREKILSNKVAAPARAGAVAPLDVR